MGGINTVYIQGYAGSIIYVVNFILVPVLIAIAFIVFLWGVYKYFIYHADSDTERTKGRDFMLYGVIGFVIIFSLWGIVNILMGTLGLGSGGIAPAFPTIGSGGAQGGSSNPFGNPSPSGSTGFAPIPGANCPATGVQDCGFGETCVNFQCVPASPPAATPVGSAGSGCFSQNDCQFGLECVKAQPTDTSGVCATISGT